MQWHRACKIYWKEVSKIDKVKYCRLVRRLLPCGREKKNRIMEQLEGSIDNFLLDEPSADFQAIQQRFGAPEEVAASLIESSGTKEVLKAIYIRKKIVLIVILALCIAVLGYISALVAEVIDFHDAFHGYGEVTVSEVDLPPDFTWDE